MECSALSFFRAECKVSDTGSAQRRASSSNEHAACVCRYFMKIDNYIENYTSIQ